MDLKLVLSDELFADLGFENNDLVTEDGMETAILISLFSDRRVTKEELPLGEKSLRGWWGDVFPDLPGDLIGSKLWLLAREKHTAEVRELARVYALESLQWLIEDGVAASVNVSVEKVSLFQSNILITIGKPSDRDVDFKYSFVWRSLNGV